MAFPNLAKNYVLSQKKVLLLGSRLIADHLCLELEREGFEVFIQEKMGITLPESQDPNAISKLREIFAHFISTFAHEEKSSVWVHAGMSPWSDQPELAQLLQELKVNSFSPSVRVLGFFGNRLHLLAQAEALGIPNLVLSFDPIYSVGELKKQIKKYQWELPLILKSGKCKTPRGVLVLNDLKDFENRLPLWFEQLRQNVGETSIFVERYLEGSRHLCVPFVRFQTGHLEFLPKVDSTLQTRFRKLIEFCPPPSLDTEVESQIQKFAKKLLDKIQYVGLGNLDFLVDSSRAFLIGGQSGFYTNFLLWEKISGTQAISWQLACYGLDHSQSPQKPQWTEALNIHLLAENPFLQVPQPGLVHELSEKRIWDCSKSKAELNLSFEAPCTIDPRGNGFIGVLSVFSKEKKQALITAGQVLKELWIAGSLQTNENYLNQLLSHPWIEAGIYHTGFVDEEFIPIVYPNDNLTLKHFSSVCNLLTESPYWFVGEVKVKPNPGELEWSEEPLLWKYQNRPAVSGILKLGANQRARVCAFPVLPNRWQVRIGDRFFLVRKSDSIPTVLGLYAQATGQVHSIRFRAGSRVPAHEAALVLETNQILVSHAFPRQVKIKKWNVKAGDGVTHGQVLAEIEMD